jgi:hypothetical protein
MGWALERWEPVALQPLENRPEWWTDPWEMLLGYHIAPWPVYVALLPPTRFKEDKGADIIVIARSACRRVATTADRIFVTRNPGPENDLVGATIGVISSDMHVTVNKTGSFQGFSDLVMGESGSGWSTSQTLTW